MTSELNARYEIGVQAAKHQLFCYECTDCYMKYFIPNNKFEKDSPEYFGFEHEMEEARRFYGFTK